MFNVKWGIVLGGIGLVLSFIVGLFSGAGFPHIILRAFAFAGVFFGLGAGLWLLINNFLPELLFPEAPGLKDDPDSSPEQPGSRINITLDDNKSLPDMFQGMDTGEDVGDIAELINGTFVPPPVPGRDSSPDSEFKGVDQRPEDSYTENKYPDDQFSSDLSSELPDIDQMAGSFMKKSKETAEEPGEWSEPVRRSAGNKPQSLKGDFNPKELAAGIRTILSEDE